MNKTIKKAAAGVLAAAITFTSAGLNDIFPAGFAITASAAEISINSTNFPDISFRNYVLLKIDTDRNEKLSVEEISAVKTISAASRSISNLTGISFFTELETLEISGNKITAIDLTANKALKTLKCGNCNMSSLDVSACSELETIHAFNNYFKNLDLSENKKLKDIYLNNGFNGYTLKSLNLPETDTVTSLQLSGAMIDELKIDISCYVNAEVMTLEGCGLTEFNAANYPKLRELNIDNNNIAEIDLSGCTNVEMLSVSCNPIEELDVSALKELKLLDVSETSLYGLDTSDNIKLTSLSAESCDQLGSLDISANPNLVRLYCSGTSMQILDLRSNVLLQTLEAKSCGLYEIYFGNKQKLKKADVSGNMLTSLDLENAPALETLDCSDNMLTSLDLDSSSSLKTLNCTGNSSSSDRTHMDFDGNKVWDVQNAEFDTESNVFVGISDVVTYKYETIEGGPDFEASIDFGITDSFEAEAYAANGKASIKWKPIKNAVEYYIYVDDGTGKYSYGYAVTKENYISGVPVIEGVSQNIKIACPRIGSSTLLYSDVLTVKSVSLAAPELSMIKHTGSVTLSWGEVAGATGYNVYRRNETSGKTELIFENLSTTVTADTPLSGCLYSYYVTALNGFAESEQSEECSLDLTINNSPKNVKVVVGNTEAVVSWDNIPSASEYKIDIYTISDDDAYSVIKTVTGCNSPETIKGLEYCQKYGFVVYAMVNGEWNELKAENIVITEPVALPAPHNVKATMSSGRVTITWDKITGVHFYDIERLDGTEWVKIDRTGYGETSFTSGILENGKKYSYRVVSIYGEYSAPSAAVSVIPGQVSVPTNVSATAGDKQVKLTWTAVSGATKYRVQRLNDSKWGTIATISTNSYTNTGLTNGTKYSYRVLASADGSTWSGVSAVASATPAAVKVSAPTNVKATAGDKQIKLTWTAVSGATKYRVQRLNDSKWGTIATVSTNSYTNTGLTNGTKYSYRVLASADGSAWSGTSAVASATPAAAVKVSVPTNVKATAGDKQVKLTWTAVSGATQYRVQRLNGSTWGTIATVSTNSYTNTGLTNGTKYSYRVLASADGSTWSGTSAVVSATPAA